MFHWIAVATLVDDRWFYLWSREGFVLEFLSYLSYIKNLYHHKNNINKDNKIIHTHTNDHLRDNYTYIDIK